MPGDIFTYNERISEYIEGLLGREAEVDTSEFDSLPLYCFVGADITRINFEEVNKLVSCNELKDIRFYGGYEIRDTKTGEFLNMKRSLVEIIASQSDERNF